VAFPVEDRAMFYELVEQWQEGTEEGREFRYNSFIDQDGTMKYTKIGVGTNLKENASSKKKNKEYDWWLSYVEELRKDAPPGLKSAFHACWHWPWLQTEDGFYQSAIQGMIFAVFFSFFILLFATRDCIMSLISMLCIFVIINSVMCMATLQDWELGVTESLSCVCCIGLSVDYVVHYAAEYSHSPKATRKDKMGDAYGHVGISILFGFLTSFGATMPLMLSVLPMGRKFGIFMSSTIVISFTTSMLLFGALSHVIGGEGNRSCCPCLDKFRANRVQ
jgi:hypothetical protein